MMNKQQRRISLLWIAVVWNTNLLSSAFAMLTTSSETIEIPLRFGDTGDEEVVLNDYHPHYNVRYQIHYHQDDRQAHGLKPGCEVPKKTAKNVKMGADYEQVEYVYEHDCDTTSLPTTSPSLAPTIVPTTQVSAMETQISTQEASSSDIHVATSHPTAYRITDSPHAPTHVPTTLHRKQNAVANPSAHHNHSLGLFVAGVVVSMAAFVVGFAASTMYTKRKQTNTKIAFAGKSTTHESSSDLHSIQLSVEDSVDSYHIEDWSVSVVSWTPTDGIEIAPSRRKNPTIEVAHGTEDNDFTSEDDEMEEIEIEFEESSSDDEEDPPLFDVIDLSSEDRSQCSF